MNINNQMNYRSNVNFGEITPKRISTRNLRKSFSEKFMNQFQENKPYLASSDAVNVVFEKKGSLYSKAKIVTKKPFRKGIYIYNKEVIFPESTIITPRQSYLISYPLGRLAVPIYVNGTEEEYILLDFGSDDLLKKAKEILTKNFLAEDRLPALARLMDISDKMAEPVKFLRGF